VISRTFEFFFISWITSRHGFQITAVASGTEATPASHLTWIYQAQLLQKERSGVGWEFIIDGEWKSFRRMDNMVTIWRDGICDGDGDDGKVRWRKVLDLWR